MIEAVFQWAGGYYQPLVRAPGAEHLTLEEHTRLVDAIEAHDPAAAQSAVHAHVTRSNELYRRIEEAQTQR